MGRKTCVVKVTRSELMTLFLSVDLTRELFKMKPKDAYVERTLGELDEVRSTLDKAHFRAAEGGNGLKVPKVYAVESLYEKYLKGTSLEGTVTATHAAQALSEAECVLLTADGAYFTELPLINCFSHEGIKILLKTYARTVGLLMEEAGKTP